ncbi:MAG: hypothetical protein C4536_03780 [Actinobacteria bacterium]|nr:MAG: hypothetical protein C4536_03780 [Actinomycetota bacterium]
MVHYATLAPSGHNTQPWRFGIGEDRIAILPDFTRRLPVVDPDDHALYISLGCALENMMIATEHFGFEAEAEYFPPSEEERLLARFKKTDRHEDEKLFEAIPKRQSNRGRYDGRPIPDGDLQKLAEAAERPGVRFMLFTKPGEIEPLIDFVKEGNLKQFNDKAFVEELVSWIRFSRKDADRSMDGLTSAAMGLPWIPSWMGRMIMRYLVTPGSQAKQSEKLIRSSSALMLFAAERDEKSCWVDVGRAFERTALTATSLGISQAHVNMPCEVLEVRRKLREHIELGDSQPMLLLRIGYAEPRPRSLRRPLEDVLI